MYKKIFLSIIIIFGCLLLFFTISLSHDDKFPSRPIENIVPYPPGGQSDTLGRAIAEFYNIGQPMYVVNMPGGAASIGIMEVYTSNPDGYRVSLCSKEIQTIGYLTGSMPAPTWKEMIPIGLITSDINTISVAKDSQFNTFEELVDFARENPGVLTWGLGGLGSSNHMFSAMVLDAFDIDVVLVPYQGGSQTRVALLGGHLSVLFNSTSEIRSLVEAGEIKPLLVCSDERSKFLPDVPSLGDFGIHGMSYSVNTGLWLPPNTPQDIVTKHESSLKSLLSNEKFVDLVESKLGYSLIWEDSETVRQSMEDVYPLYEKIINDILK